ncbi:GNAT family N-acetyltransferase [Paenibacillus tarimensis]|nr:GNAT family N-acetyltransferase [Paenibacillus tarimensis]
MVALIRACKANDLGMIHTIINDAAQAYRGIIPADRYHKPYMPENELQREIQDGVEFWGYEEDGELIGVMGIQDKGDVTLIRHAYVRTTSRSKGIGTRLLRHLTGRSDKPVLIGTWAAADWAIRFYRNNGFELVSQEEKNILLKQYWQIPERQVETSVVLTSRRSAV